MEFEVYTGVRIQFVAFLVVTICSLVDGTKHGVTTQKTVVWNLTIF
jgi:hypothetical protein